MLEMNGSGRPNFGSRAANFFQTSNRPRSACVAIEVATVSFSPHVVFATIEPLVKNTRSSRVNGMR